MVSGRFLILLNTNMERFRGYRLELKLNKTQRILCAKSAGTARFAYNWKLKQLIDNYETAKEKQATDKPKVRIGTSIDWHKEWVLLKNEYPWIRETSKCCGQEALRDLEKGMKKFFKKKAGFPNFKKRGQKDSFYLDDQVFISSKHIQLPTFGKVRLKEHFYPILDGRIKLSNAVISRQADRWFVSFFIKEGECESLKDLSKIKIEEILGIDLGIKELAITSDGQTFDNPKAYSKNLKRLKKYQRMVSRKVKGSNNKKKAILKLSRLHMKVSNIRKDNIQKMTTSIVRTSPEMIVIESLRVKNMMKNHKLASSIADSSFGKIKETFKYKCSWEGIHLVFAPTFYASSKFCSHCGKKNESLKLSDREWTCQNCNTHHDRDLNASLNLQYYGLWLLDKHLGVSPTTVSSTGSQACGEERLQFLQEQCSSVKQEFNEMYEST